MSWYSKWLLVGLSALAGCNALGPKIISVDDLDSYAIMKEIENTFGKEKVAEALRNDPDKRIYVGETPATRSSPSKIYPHQIFNTLSDIKRFANEDAKKHPFGWGGIESFIEVDNGRVKRCFESPCYPRDMFID